MKIRIHSINEFGNHCIWQPEQYFIPIGKRFKRLSYFK